MTLLDFINKLLGRQPASADTARQRLQLVLAHDRSDLNPELLEQMRREILEVVSRYVEIDLEEGDVSLETEDRVTALVANLPIKRARAIPLPAPDPIEPSPSRPELGGFDLGSPWESLEGQRPIAVVLSQHQVAPKPISTEPISPEPITVAEGRVLEALMEGLPNKAIAARLFLSPRTVESHISHLLLKTGCGNRTQLLLWAMGER